MRRLLLPLLLLAITLTAQGYYMIIHNPNSQELKDFQVRVKLPSELVGKAISITDRLGNSVPFCYETSTGECTTDPTKGDGYIWVKVPNIPANGDASLIVQDGSNGAVNGDKVFDFYDDFNYPNGPFDGAGKWKVNRYSGDTSKECIIENGILWLVKQSRSKGCNIRALNFGLKYNQKVVIEFKFKVDYVCGNSNDGDGIALVIDGKDDRPSDGCNKGFSLLDQGIDAVIYTDDRSGYGYIGIANGIGGCTPSSSTIDYMTLPSKSEDLDEGIVTIRLTGSEVLLHYEDLDPADGLKSGDVKAVIWNPNGNGYFMVGAGTGGSECYYEGDDSAHGIDWIRVRKYAPQEPTVTFGSIPSVPIAFDLASSFAFYVQISKYSYLNSDNKGLLFIDNGNNNLEVFSINATSFTQLAEVKLPLPPLAISSCCNEVAVVSEDDVIRIFNETGNLVKTLDSQGFDSSILLLPNGTVACSTRCVFIDMNNNTIWNTDVGKVEYKMAQGRGYLYVPDSLWNQLLVIRLGDGDIVKRISIDSPKDVYTCGNYLALETQDGLKVYSIEDPSDPKLLWEKSGSVSGIAFSPECEYLATNLDGKLYIFKSDSGNVVLSKDLNVKPLGWWQGFLLVSNGDVRIDGYYVVGYLPPSGEVVTTTLPVFTLSTAYTTTTITKYITTVIYNTTKEYVTITTTVKVPTVITSTSILTVPVVQTITTTVTTGTVTTTKTVITTLLSTTTFITVITSTVVKTITTTLIKTITQVTSTVSSILLPTTIKVTETVLSTVKETTSTVLTTVISEKETIVKGIPSVALLALLPSLLKRAKARKGRNRK